MLSGIKGSPDWGSLCCEQEQHFDIIFWWKYTFSKLKPKMNKI